MKINSPGGFEQYQNYIQGLKGSDSGHAKIKGEAGSVAGNAVNTDKVTFSDQAAEKASISRLTTALAAEVEDIGSESHLASLRESVASGSYSVPTDKLASAILGWA